MISRYLALIFLWGIVLVIATGVTPALGASIVGDYQYPFLAGGGLGLITACLALTIRRTELSTPVMQAATEFAGA